MEASYRSGSVSDRASFLLGIGGKHSINLVYARPLIDAIDEFANLAKPGARAR